MSGEKKTCAAVIMASGTAERFGSDKLLAELQGRPVILRTADAVLKVFEDEDAPILLLTRRKEIAELVRREYSHASNLEVILWKGGPQSETLRLAVQTLMKLPQKKQPDGCMFIAGDQPLIAETDLLNILKEFRMRPKEDPSVLRLASGGIPGNPVLWPAVYFDQLQALKGDKGGSQLLKGGRIPQILIEAASPASVLDIDTPEDLRQAVDLIDQDH